MTVHIIARNFAYDGSSRGNVVPIAMDYTRTQRCLKPFDSMYVDYNGSVMICCNLRSDVKGHEIGYMGNAFDDKLDNIFNQYTNVNSNSQTTSTKCQYQLAASKPKWFSGEKWPRMHRSNMTKRMTVPRVTCIPWKPVNIKKVEP